ncbi:MAG: translation initiation factor IF-2 [Calditrichaeota bacterium]|nr:MAG: translation initiation factor IF-2 [Calditrichota bacterium]MBL1203901.1 translation initiation factor IF-2 [Calditrichota bacterium]NOG43734.1 translation initiation factor IF-2 [Calditrichota bacterium]
MAKKYKLFKICKELNLGLDTIKGFLEKQGVKVTGPNSAVHEDLYFEIVERFATDKEKADKLRERKKETTDEAAPEEVVEVAEDVVQSEYMKAIKKSIEDRTEELTKPEVKEEKPKPVKEVEPVQEEVKEPEEAPVEAEEKPAPEKVEVVAKEEKKVPEEKKEEPKKQVFEKIDLDAFKPKKKKEKPKDEGLTEKEKKRLKALEMIRKDGKKGKAAKPDLRNVGVDGDGQPRRKKHKKPKRKEVDLKEVQDNVKKTLANLDTKSKKTKHRKKVTEVEGELIEENIVEVTEFISANDLANLMDVPISEIITKCLELGLVVSINQRLDIDTITLLAEEYGFKAELSNVSEFVEDEEEELEENEADLESRAPIVTIMGHVDHGKTSLLDYLRKSHVVDGEAGGITQHVAAYEVDNDGKKVTFLDTPGHEAFTAMRARGAQVTDIVILIISADDAVMPQTDEALDHAKAAGVKIIIAINKIDKPGSNSEKIRQQLAERNVLVEDWGGEYQCAEISAKTGQGIPELLEKIHLEAEMLDLKANPKRMAAGFVIESRLDKGKGAIATVLVQTGSLKVGDSFVSGQFNGKVRALLNEHDVRLKSIGPAQPALVVGFMGVPQAGDRFVVKKDEKVAREIANKRQQLKREQDAKQHKHVTLAQISEQILRGEVQELNILVKADVDGSAEALADSLIKLNTEEVQVNVVRKAVGPISESDVLLASASGAVIIGFHVRANAKAKELAEREEVDMHIYRVVYDAINDVKMALEGLLKPTENEVVLGQIEVRETFKISKIGVIAGCHVISGKISRNNKIRLIRDDIEIYSGSLASLKRFKDDVKEVATGFECGIQVENYNDLKVGDIIEPFEITHTKRKLETA